MSWSHVTLLLTSTHLHFCFPVSHLGRAESIGSASGSYGTTASNTCAALTFPRFHSIRSDPIASLLLPVAVTVDFDSLYPPPYLARPSLVVAVFRRTGSRRSNATQPLHLAVRARLGPAPAKQDARSAFTRCQQDEQERVASSGAPRPLALSIYKKYSRLGPSASFRFYPTPGHLVCVLACRGFSAFHSARASARKPPPTNRPRIALAHIG